MADTGFKHKIKFQKQQNTSAVTNNIKNRKRNIICFDPPFSLNVSAISSKSYSNYWVNISQKTHQLHKLFNRNNVKDKRF